MCLFDLKHSPICSYRTDCHIIRVHAKLESSWQLCILTNYMMLTLFLYTKSLLFHQTLLPNISKPHHTLNNICWVNNCHSYCALCCRDSIKYCLSSPVTLLNGHSMLTVIVQFPNSPVLPTHLMPLLHKILSRWKFLPLLMAWAPLTMPISIPNF